MKQIIRALLLSSILSLAHASTDDDIALHFEAPGEDNVVIFTPCFANEDGFGGVRTESSFTAEYYYEMVYKTGDTSVEEIVLSFERDSTNFILQSDLFDGPCSEIQRRQASGGGAQGISARPDDQPLQGIQCSSISSDDAGTDCIVMSGAFEVFYDGGDSDALKQQFEESITNGINNNGKNNGVDISNPNIVEVAAVPNPTTNKRDPDDSNNQTDISSTPEEGGNSTPLIIGATVGAVLVVGAAALYRSRQAGANSPSDGAAPEGGADSQGADV